MPEPKLTKSAKALLEYFRTFPAGEPITATRKELATALNAGTASISRAVSQLEENGYIRIESGKENCKANTYFLNDTLRTNVLLENCTPPATFVSKDFTPKANAVLKSFTPPAAEPEKPPVKHEIISVSATVPELIHYPIDKVSQNLFRYLEDGTYSMSAEKSGSKDELTTIVTLDFEELKKNKALADIIDRILTPFDKRVYVAAGTLQQAGNKYISATQIYRQMGGKGSPAAKHISKIIESCTKMMGIRLSIDNQEEAAKYNYREFQRGLFYLFPVKIIENVAINGRTTDFCIQFLDELTLFAFAKQRKQITEYTPEQWSLPFSMTDDNILLDDYFRSRTARMRRDKARSKNHSYNGKMLYSKIYENCGIDNKVKRTRAIEKIRKLLNHYKTTEIIIDYEEGKDGITIEV